MSPLRAWEGEKPEIGGGAAGGGYCWDSSAESAQ